MLYSTDVRFPLAVPLLEVQERRRPVLDTVDGLEHGFDCDRSDQLNTGALLAETGTITMLAARRQLLRTSGVGQRIYLR